ncbi:MAG: hypothetical protein OXP69_02755 [Spirochaetaceae bacterium]|nr:hypothetical protein [Spirochaetaceae bacterium]MDE0449421.1 hypothetical protein [Spirochaetaceae bacterium]
MAIGSGMAAADNATWRAMRSIAAIPDAAWSPREGGCSETAYHRWVLMMYVHTDPGGRVQFWRCIRCGKRKLQVLDSGATVYADSAGQHGLEEASGAVTKGIR